MMLKSQTVGFDTSFPMKYSLLNLSLSEAEAVLWYKKGISFSNEEAVILCQQKMNKWLFGKVYPNISLLMPCVQLMVLYYTQPRKNNCHERGQENTTMAQPPPPQSSLSRKEFVWLHSTIASSSKSIYFFEGTSELKKEM